MARHLPRAVSFVALAALVATLFPAALTSAASPTADAALSWLRTQQQTDGGFEVLGFPGFETADVVFALASVAQTGAWDFETALAAVAATRVGGVGNSPLDHLDDLADTPITKGQAAKAIVLATNPLGIDATQFDPKCDGGTTNLVTVLGAPGGDGQFGFSLGAFNSVLYAARAYALTAGAGQLPDASITTIRNAQKSDGSWSFDGSNAGTGGDIDTTAQAVLTLLEDADVLVADADVDEALDYLEGQQQGSGAWQSFFVDDANSTAMALLALGVAGRTTTLAAGDAWIASQQQGDGRIASQNDGFGINTFATSQSVQGLVRLDVPRVTSPIAMACSDGDGITDETEWGAPNGGDGSNDGIPDADQADVASLPDVVTGGYVTVQSTTGAVEDVSSIAPSSLPALPAGVTLPRGVLQFTVAGVGLGGTVNVQITLHGGPALTKYYKLQGGTWTDFTANATFAGNVVTLTLVDGGAGDTGGADGEIVDPSGPASVSAGAGGGTGGGTGGVANAIVADPSRLTG